MLRSFLLRIRPSVVGVDLPRTLFGSQFYATANLGSAQTQTVPSADAIGKEALIRMRKETGYSYARCRNALKKFGEQDFEAARQWLKEAGIREGWEKAAKLESRSTNQGLFGLAYEGSVGAAVELRSETDFVSRSGEFKQLVEEVTLAALEHAKQLYISIKAVEEGDKLKLVEIGLDPKEILTAKQRPVAEAVAMTIGKVGENIVIGRATLYFSRPSVEIVGHTHPIEYGQQIKMGRFVSLVGIQRYSENASAFPTEKLAGQICQHIIGMAPTELGRPFSPEEKLEIEQKAEKERTDNEAAKIQEDKGEELNAGEEAEEEIEYSFKGDEDEMTLLRQSFMLNPSNSVHEYLEVHGAKITDFCRFELGK